MMSTIPNQKYVTKLLRDLGVEASIPDARFVRQVRKRFGRDGERVLDAMSRIADGERLDVYGLKNSSLELSMCVTSQLFQHIHAAFLGWLVGAFRSEPKLVLDIGCESAVLTCAMAKHWPGARFVGLEPNAEAAEIASQLVRVHRLDNVEIRSMRIEDIGEQAVDLRSECDLVVGLCVFHEILRESPDFDPDSASAFGVEDAAAGELPDGEALRSVVHALAPDGVFLAGNRWGFPEKTLRWLRLTEEAGLEVDLAGSCMLESESPYGAEMLPLTVQRARGNPVRATPDDVLALHAYPRFRDCFQSMAFEGPMAEGIYRALGPRSLLDGFEAIYDDGPGVERMEIFAAGSVAGVYQSTTLGFRHLQLGALAFLPEMVSNLSAEAEKRAGVATVRTIRPDTLDNRWSLYGLR